MARSLTQRVDRPRDGVDVGRRGGDSPLSARLLAGLAQKPQIGGFPLNADEHCHRPTTHGDPSPRGGALCCRVNRSGHREPR
jgi:hypothetical protein